LTETPLPMVGRRSGYTRGNGRLVTTENWFRFGDVEEVGSRLPINLLAISSWSKVVDRKSAVGFRFDAERWIGLGANPEMEVQATSQGGSSSQPFLLQAEVVVQESISGSDRLPRTQSYTKCTV